MSRSRNRVEALRQIAAIRATTARLAEARCAAAARDVSAAEDGKKLRQEKLGNMVEGWESAMNSAVFDPQSRTYWGHAVNQAQSEVDVAVGDVTRYEAMLKQKQEHMAGKIASERCAETLFSSARKKLFNDVENKHLAEQADRITRREMRR